MISERVGLRPASGGNLAGACPFHDGGPATLYVSAQRRVYYCFGCGVGGDVITFVMAAEKVSFADAVDRLGVRAGIEVGGPGQTGSGGPGNPV